MAAGSSAAAAARPGGGSSSSAAAAAGSSGASRAGSSGGAHFSSPPAGAPRTGGGAGGASAGDAAFIGRKNAGEVVDVFNPTEHAAPGASPSSSPASSSVALPAALAEAAAKPHARPAISTLRGLGLRTFKNVSELVRGAGAARARAAADATLANTDPFPLVVTSVSRWAEVTGMRVGLPPPPPPPASAQDAPPSPGDGGSSGVASPASAGSPAAVGSPPPAAGSPAGSVGGPAAGALDTSVGSIEGGAAAAAAAAAAPPDTRRFELPANRNLEEPFKYMFTTLERRAAALEGRLEELGDAIVSAHGLEGLLEPVGTVSQSPVVYVGRVCVEGEGKINATSVLLEGSNQDALPGGLASRNPHLKAGRILLDLREVPGFSLFPGQVVAARGMNTSGERLVVQALYTGAPHALPVTPVEHVHALADAATSAPEGAGPLRLAVAAGPFTLAADWNYTPLEEMLLSLMSSGPPPDVLVLVGVARARGEGGGGGLLFGPLVCVSPTCLPPPSAADGSLCGCRAPRN